MERRRAERAAVTMRCRWSPSLAAIARKIRPVAAIEVEEPDRARVSVPGVVVMQGLIPAVGHTALAARDGMPGPNAGDAARFPTLRCAASAPGQRPPRTGRTTGRTLGPRARRPAGAGALRHWPTPPDADRARDGAAPARLATHHHDSLAAAGSRTGSVRWPTVCPAASLHSRPGPSRLR